jgi:hypothetical protein
VTSDKEYEYTSSNEKVKLSTKESNVNYQASSISKANIPTFSKILITDDGKDESNKVLNYAVCGSNDDNMSNKDVRLKEKY